MAARTFLILAAAAGIALLGQNASAQIFMPRPQEPVAMPPGVLPGDDGDVIPPDSTIQSQPLPPVNGVSSNEPNYTMPPGANPDQGEPAIATLPPVDLNAPGQPAPEMAPPAVAPAAAAPIYVPQPGFARTAPSDAVRPPADVESERSTASLPSGNLPPEYQPETEKAELPPNLRRQVVDFKTKEPAGTIIIDTPNTYLYLVMGNGKAMRYGIGVGREGFTWAGKEKITRMAEWPDWFPPSEMIERQPYLPRFMAGGESNPLGARALYLGKTLYRIHGTNQPSTIGTFVSSGCIRLVNDDIEDLYTHVKVGTKVIVLPGSPPAVAASKPPAASSAVSDATASVAR
jgi:lipoprotein-anchoring transpeptidase ErfK/SrfK